MWNFFAKEETPEEQCKKWNRDIRKQTRVLDRDISNLDRAEKKAIGEIKKYAKTGNTKAVKIIAKEVNNTRKAKNRMYTTKAQLNSVAINMKTQLAQLKVQKSLAFSGEVMSSMNKLVNIPEITTSMRGMAREMEKAGLIQELVDDTMADIEDPEIEGEANAEVDKIIEELTAGILLPAGAAPTRPVAGQSAPEMSDEAKNVEKEFQAMQNRLQGL
jgi:charged multivesicular body protein 3